MGSEKTADRKMVTTTARGASRRDFLRLVAGATAFGPFFLFPQRALASQKSLKISKWAHFLPEFDQWFVNVLAKEWGQKNDTRVTVDLIPVEKVSATAAAEVKASRGSDVFMFPWPPAEYYQHVIDHDEIYQSVLGKYGQIDFVGHRSTYYPKAQKRFAFADSWIPAPFQYLEDCWGEIGMPAGPITYVSLRSGGKRIKEKLGIPCGLAFTPTLEGNITANMLLVNFGGAVLDIEGNLLLDKGVRTLAALAYAKRLHQEAGTPEQLAWGPLDNVRNMVAHKTSCTINGISLTRRAEKEKPETAKKIRVQPPLLGSAGAGIAAVPHVTNCSAVWNFSTNQEGAKKFLADLLDNSKTAYEKSQGCNFPFFQKAVPDLIKRLENDPQANPPDKYLELKDALHWTHDLGVPAYATPAFMEVFNTFVIPRMFISVMKGDLSLQEATNAAAKEVQRIADKWKQAS
jgi:multiple sugar transport system substrate-binding protein